MKPQQSNENSYTDVYWNEVAFNGVLKSSKKLPKVYAEETILYNYSLSALPVNTTPMPFKKVHVNSNLGAFAFFLGIAVLWSWFFQTNYKTVVEINKAQFDFKSFYNQVNESSGGNTAVLIGLLFSAMALISYGAAEAFNYFEIKSFLTFNMGGLNVVVAFVVLLIAIFAKVLVLFLSSIITGNNKVFNQYFALNIVSLQFVGVCLFPLMVLYRFAPLFNPQIFLYAFVGIISIMFVYRLLRMFVVALNQRSADFLHIILYICALEILPIFLLIKWQLR